MKIKVTLSLIIYFLVMINLFSTEKLYFSIDYVGFSVANIEFIHNQNNITIKAKSSRLSNFFSVSFDNVYNIEVDSVFRPVSYFKEVNQKNFQENAVHLYDFESLRAEYNCRINNINLHYPITHETRDFFSALYFIRNNKNTEQFDVDSAGIIWTINVRKVENEILNTSIGRKEVVKYAITFFKNDNIDNFNTQKLRSDVLTNNLVNEENLLYFWFTDDEERIPVRAQYVMSPFNVAWNIKKVVR